MLVSRSRVAHQHTKHTHTHTHTHKHTHTQTHTHRHMHTATRLNSCSAAPLHSRRKPLWKASNWRCTEPASRCCAYARTYCATLRAVTGVSAPRLVALAFGGVLATVVAPAGWCGSRSTLARSPKPVSTSTWRRGVSGVAVGGARQACGARRGVGRPWLARHQQRSEASPAGLPHACGSICRLRATHPTHLKGKAQLGELRRAHVQQPHEAPGRVMGVAQV
jgi:hypothetical protein